VDAIFMGDAMTTRSVTTGIVEPALAPFTIDAAMALASLAALDGLYARWVLPRPRRCLDRRSPPGAPADSGGPGETRSLTETAHVRRMPAPQHRPGRRSESCLLTP
jgi:hypothetical protein